MGLLVKGLKDEHVIKNFFSFNIMSFPFSLSEFGEVDPDKLKAAVKTFIHSCAGYSVATYVLVYTCMLYIILGHMISHVTIYHMHHCRALVIVTTIISW